MPNKEFTLRNKIDEEKVEFHERGRRDEYWSETLAWVIQDYHGSKGSVLDFTEDDWRVCKENGMALLEVLALCDEEYLSHTSLSDFVEDFISDWKNRTGDYDATDVEIDRDDVIAGVTEFYTWNRDKLPVIEKIYTEC